MCPLDLNTAFGLLCCTHYPADLFFSVLYSQGQTYASKTVGSGANGKRKDGLLLESFDSWQRELLQCPHSWHCGFMNKNSLPDLGELLSVQCPVSLLEQECSLLSLRSQLRIAATEEAAQLWFFSCGQVQGKGLSLSFGHSGMVNLGRQVEHMAAPPMIGGLLMWRRSGTGAKSFCLLTSGFSAWSPENFGHKSK